ncbi:MAG: hypothetical protein Q7S65_06025, partial [Nanoarchaeota archaeon]|nr:hypothetical protein [Nanoarchaeota archaeon]
MGLENALSRRAFLGTMGALAAGMVLDRSGLFVPEVYAGSEPTASARPSLRADLEKILAEDPGLVEQARQRIYDELGGAKAPQTLGSKKMRVSLLLDTLKGIGKQANLEVDSKLYSALGDR